jgi:hypothetical protein
LSTQHFGPFGSGAGAGSAWATPLPRSRVATLAATTISVFVIRTVLSVKIQLEFNSDAKFGLARLLDGEDLDI